MNDYFDKLFEGRHGMDEFSKTLFWFGAGAVILSFVIPVQFLKSFLFLWGAIILFYAFVRAFSRRLDIRELENSIYLVFVDKQKTKLKDWKYRFSQRKQYRFYKCPNCKTIIRVPRGKGKIHINCKCGYTLYRKT